MRRDNAAMAAYLAGHGLPGVRAKYISTGMLRGSWLLSKPRSRWTAELARKLNGLGFSDLDGQPLTERNCDGERFFVFVRAPAEKSPTEVPSVLSPTAVHSAQIQAEWVSTEPRPHEGPASVDTTWSQNVLGWLLMPSYLLGVLLRGLGRVLVELADELGERGLKEKATSDPTRPSRLGSSLLRWSVRILLLVVAAGVFFGLAALGWSRCRSISDGYWGTSCWAGHWCCYSDCCYGWRVRPANGCRLT